MRCPGQDHSGLRAACGYEPRGLGRLLCANRVPAFLCLFVYVCPAWFCLNGSVWDHHRPDMPLLWGIALPCVWGLVTAANWKTREKRRGEENPNKDEKKRVGVSCECRCAWTPWVFINFPKILHFCSAIKPRGSEQTQLCEIFTLFVSTASRYYCYNVFPV